MVDFHFGLLVNWARAIFISPLWGVNVRLYARTRVEAEFKRLKSFIYLISNWLKRCENRTFPESFLIKTAAIHWLLIK